MSVIRAKVKKRSQKMEAKIIHLATKSLTNSLPSGGGLRTSIIKFQAPFRGLGAKWGKRIK
jgi:hypothetical protein